MVAADSGEPCASGKVRQPGEPGHFDAKQATVHRHGIDRRRTDLCLLRRTASKQMVRARLHACARAPINPRTAEMVPSKLVNIGMHLRRRAQVRVLGDGLAGMRQLTLTSSRHAVVDA
jgi:hypothetical protein